jgi:hypothetical protein
MKKLTLVIVLGIAVWANEAACQTAPARMVQVSFEYLEACEVGPECKPVVINRKKGEPIEVVLPKLLRTSVTLWDAVNFKRLLKRTGIYRPIQRMSGGAVDNEHEIILPLSQLPDGIYYVWVVGDSVGGTFQVHLKTI